MTSKSKLEKRAKKNVNNMFEFSFAASISDKLIVSKQLSMIMIFMSLWPADGQNLVDEKTIKREC